MSRVSKIKWKVRIIQCQIKRREIRIFTGTTLMTKIRKYNRIPMLRRRKIFRRLEVDIKAMVKSGDHIAQSIWLVMRERLTLDLLILQTCSSR